MTNSRCGKRCGERWSNPAPHNNLSQRNLRLSRPSPHRHHHQPSLNQRRWLQPLWSIRRHSSPCPPRRILPVSPVNAKQCGREFRNCRQHQLRRRRRLQRQRSAPCQRQAPRQRQWQQWRLLQRQNPRQPLLRRRRQLQPPPTKRSTHRLHHSQRPNRPSSRTC